jgi:hypothetical protein
VFQELSMNGSNTPTSGDTPVADTHIVVADQVAANEAAVDAPAQPDSDSDSGDKANASSSVVSFRINDKRGTRR